MPGENVWDWSTTAADNDDADSLINWREGQARASVNDSARSLMAAIAKTRDLQNGSIWTNGSPNAQYFTSGLSFTAIPVGMRVMLHIGPALTNTGSTTLTMDSAAAVIHDQLGNPLVGGELVAYNYAEFRYDGTYWVLLYRTGATFFPSTTEMLFRQPAAPLGWTKVTSFNDYALRVVSGSVLYGGTVPFSTCFARATTDAHTLLLTEIPSHTHPVYSWQAQGNLNDPGYPATLTGGPGYEFTLAAAFSFENIYPIKYVGGSGQHIHTMDMRLQYVDVILGRKD